VGRAAGEVGRAAGEVGAGRVGDGGAGEDRDVRDREEAGQAVRG
jgi:hypothetical protein